MTLDAESTALLSQMTETGVKPFAEMTPQEARTFTESMRPQPSVEPEMAQQIDRRVPVTGGAVPIRVLIPRGTPRGMIVYYHGGGWLLGTIADYELLGRRLAHRTNCAVTLVGYRLAPEYRFPTAVDDSYASLVWVDSHLDELVADRTPIIVAGDSAGGNLAAVMALKARDLKGPAIAMQVLVYPVTDCDFETTSYRDPANALVLNRDAMIWFWDHYAPDPEGRMHPDACPLRAPNTSREPPALVRTAEHDPLRDEGELYATRMLKDRVPVEHKRFEGQMHGFLSMFDVLPASEVGIGYIADAVGRCLDRTV